MDYVFTAVLSVAAIAYCFAEWHIYKACTLSEMYSAANARKQYLDSCTRAAFATLYDLIYNKPCHENNKFAWQGFTSQHKRTTLVPNCRAIVHAKRQGVRIEDIAVQRVMDKPYAIHFTLPDVTVRK